MPRSIWVLAAVTSLALLGVVLTSRRPTRMPGVPAPAKTAQAESDEPPAFASTPRAETYYVPPTFAVESNDGPAALTGDGSTPVNAGLPRVRSGRKGGTTGTVAVSTVAWTPRTDGTQEEYLADALFRRLDANGDGVLTGDEIPTALQQTLGSRKSIDRETFAALFQDAVQQFRREQTAAAKPASAQPTLPKWFQTLDTDHDGQVSLYEWRAGGRSVAEFQQIDTNGDGILTRQEVQAFLAREGASTTSGTTPGTKPGGPKSTADTKKPTSTQNDPKNTQNAKLSAQRARSNALFSHYLMLAAGASPKSNPQLAMSGAGLPAGGAGGAPTPNLPIPMPEEDPDREMATVPLPLDDPINDRPYWLLRDSQNRAALDANERSDVVFLGDSVTDYLQDRDGAPLWEEYYKPLGALNFGVGAIRTSHVLWQVETGQVARAAPKVVVLLIGSNNLGLVGQEPEEVAAGIEKIVDELGAQLPKTRILLLGILPRVDSGAPDPNKIQRVNSLISELHDGRRVFYQDIGSNFLSSDGSISKDVMPDGAHPSLWGYELYSEAVWPSLMLLLK